MCSRQGWYIFTPRSTVSGESNYTYKSSSISNPHTPLTRVHSLPTPCQHPQTNQKNKRRKESSADRSKQKRHNKRTGMNNQQIVLIRTTHRGKVICLIRISQIYTRYHIFFLFFFLVSHLFCSFFICICKDPSFISFRLRLLNRSREYCLDAFLQSVPAFIIAANSS